jgi:hypothetical protein
MMTNGSVLLVTPIGVFLNMEMLLASSLMSLAESSRSLATLVASFPVSFWTFCRHVLNLMTRQGFDRKTHTFM